MRIKTDLISVVFMFCKKQGYVIVISDFDGKILFRTELFLRLIRFRSTVSLLLLRTAE